MLPESKLQIHETTRRMKRTASGRRSVSLVMAVLTSARKQHYPGRRVSQQLNPRRNRAEQVFRSLEYISFDKPAEIAQTGACRPVLTVLLKGRDSTGCRIVLSGTSYFEQKHIPSADWRQSHATDCKVSFHTSIDRENMPTWQVCLSHSCMRHSSPKTEIGHV